MVQPALRIFTADQAADVARALETPTEVDQFVALGKQSSAVREFLKTQEWASINWRIIGDGTPPLGPPNSVEELARLFRWLADGSFGDRPSDDAAAAYRHAALEIAAFGRRREPAGTVEKIAVAAPAAVGSSPAAAAVSQAA